MLSLGCAFLFAFVVLASKKKMCKNILCIDKFAEVHQGQAWSESVRKL